MAQGARGNTRAHLLSLPKRVCCSITVCGYCLPHARAAVEALTLTPGPRVMHAVGLRPVHDFRIISRPQSRLSAEQLNLHIPLSFELSKTKYPFHAHYNFPKPIVDSCITHPLSILPRFWPLGQLEPHHHLAMDASSRIPNTDTQQRHLSTPIPLLWLAMGHMWDHTAWNARTALPCPTPAMCDTPLCPVVSRRRQLQPRQPLPNSTAREAR